MDNSAVTDYERKINLTALRKCDEFVLDILETSSQVAVYKFDAAKNAWEKTDIEGTFFLYRRSSLPKYSVMIMNRLNRENLNVHIGKEMEVKVQKPFLLYKDPSTGIQGIWFNNTEKCVKIGERIGNLYTTGVKGREKEVRDERGQPTTSDVEVEKRDDVDERNVLSIFAEAQRKYDKNKVQTTTKGVSVSTPTQTSTSENTILSGKTRSKSLNIQPAPPPLLSPNESIQALSTAVEHEDRQIHETLDDDPCIVKSSPLRLSASSMSKSLPNSSKKIQRQLFTQESPQYTKQGANEKIPFPAAPAPQTTPISKAIVVKPVLSSQRSGSDITLAASLMSPLAFKPTKSLSLNQPEQPPPPPVLTKEQLQDTLIDLLQKDSEFLQKIHSAYLENAAR